MDAGRASKLGRLGAGVVSLLILSGATSFAQTPSPVYPGCAVPPTAFRNVWRIDPVNGQTAEAMTAAGIPMPAIGAKATAATQGSPQHPWNSLQAVFNPPAASGYSYPLLTTAPYRHVVGSAYQTVAGPLAGPIQPGDEILLMSGKYGAVTVGYGPIPGVNNPNFVTVAAAPGQTPVLTSLNVFNSSMLRFVGLKVQALFPALNYNNLITVADGGGGALVTHDIVFSDMSVSNADPAVYETWAQAQWQYGSVGFVAHGTNEGANTSCIALLDSHVYALHEDIVCTSRNSTCSYNELDHYTDNAITYGSNNLLIRGNYIHDPIDVGLSYHMDAMQGEGQPLAAGHKSLTWNNVIIDSNIIVEHNDPKNQWLQQTNGIDDYSGVPYLTWNNLQVTNNLYIGSSVNGILFAGIANSLIGDNILINNDYAPRTPPPDINLAPSPLNSNVRHLQQYRADHRRADGSGGLPRSQHRHDLVRLLDPKPRRHIREELHMVQAPRLLWRVGRPTADAIRRLFERGDAPRGAKAPPLSQSAGRYCCLASQGEALRGEALRDIGGTWLEHGPTRLNREGFPKSRLR